MLAVANEHNRRKYRFIRGVLIMNLAGTPLIASITGAGLVTMPRLASIAKSEGGTKTLL